MGQDRDKIMNSPNQALVPFADFLRVRKVEGSEKQKDGFSSTARSQCGDATVGVASVT